MRAYLVPNLVPPSIFPIKKANNSVVTFCFYWSGRKDLSLRSLEPHSIKDMFPVVSNLYHSCWLFNDLHPPFFLFFSPFSCYFWKNCTLYAHLFINRHAMGVNQHCWLTNLLIISSLNILKILLPIVGFYCSRWKNMVNWIQKATLCDNLLIAIFPMAITLIYRGLFFSQS